MSKGFNFYALLILLSALFMAGAASVQADEMVQPHSHPMIPANPPPPPPIHRPIVAKWDLFGGMKYYYDGILIADDQSLKAFLDTVHDPQVDHLLQQSQSDHTVGILGLVGGNALILGGVLSGNSTDNGQQYNLTATSGVLILVGAVVDFGGALLFQESNTTKFTAVERYNQIVRGETDLSVENRQSAPPGDLSVAFKF
jgi:hypothetical protein